MQPDEIRKKKVKTPEQALAALMRLCARAEKSQEDARRLMRGWGLAERDAEGVLAKLVRDRFDMTILLIEHDMKLVGGICDELTVLCFGQELVTGPTRDVLNDPQVIKAYLGDE